MYNGAPLPSTAGTFTSTAADLLPIRNSIRASLAFGGDLTRTGLEWDFEGDTEDYDPLTSLHTRRPHGPLDPVILANFGTLSAELAALSMDPGLGAILGGVSLPALPAIPYVDGYDAQIGFDASSLAWVTPPPPPTVPPGRPAGAALRFAFPLEVENIDLNDGLDVLLDVGPYNVPLTMDVTATPCGDCSTPAVACRETPGVVAAGYRSSIASGLGYGSDDTNATYPDIGLNFGVTPGPAINPASISGGTSFTAACPFAIADTPLYILDDILGLRPEIQRWINPILDLVRVGGGPFRYWLGLIVCEILTDIIDGEVRKNLAPTATDGAPPPIQPIPIGVAAAVNLAVNPPVLSTTAAVGNLPVAGLPIDTVVGRASVQVNLVAGPIVGGVPTGPPLTVNGAYTDALFNTVALGGSAVATTTVNLVAVNNACNAGVGLTPADLLAVCVACAPPSGACVPTPTNPAPVCAAFCAPPGAATGPFLPNAALPVPPATVTFAPAPNLANILASTPLIAETIRRWFSNPLPRGARYSGAAVGATPGTATFSYIVDPDDDCVSQETDICPNVFDPGQPQDGDGDAFGALCDLCAGIPNATNLDTDGDLAGDECDCDIDNDGCNNEVEAFACAPSSDGLFDRSPRVPGSVDFDGDGVVDDCDNDRDEDGILEVPPPGSPMDNCPLGDGDDTYEPGTDADQNPDQTDSGGLLVGDICDALCPYPDAPACDVPIAGGGGGGGAGAGFGPGMSSGFPGVPGFSRGCAGLPGANCDFLAFLDCPGGDYDLCWRPDLFGSLTLVGEFGQTLAEIDPAQFGLSGGLTSSVMPVPDLDGDGLEDVLVAAPRAETCFQGGPCTGQLGAIAVFGSANGSLLARVTGTEVNGRFGAAVARLGDAIAVGAPDANGGAGSVQVFRFDEAGATTLTLTLTGERAGDQFGSHIAPAFGSDTAAPSFLIGAPGARFGSGRIVIANASQGITHRFDGPMPSGRMSAAVLIGTRSDFTVVAGMPDATSGRGAIAFFSGRGSPRVERGTRAQRLGEEVVVLDGVEVAASAPGDGSIVRFSRRGARLGTIRSGMPFFGTGLSSPGDLDGDGWGDLVVAVGLDTAGDEMLSVPLTRSSP